MACVTTQYPPYLAALIERDIAAGRLRSAEGTFDLKAFARVFGNPAGYYEPVTIDVGLEQFLGIWGSTIYGGYRLTEGDLPDYYRRRTEGGGNPRIGLKIPLLQDGSIDYRRAAVLKAQLEQELADPAILRQQLDFIRAGTVAYFKWVAAGRRLALAEDLLRLARDRQSAVASQVERGLSPRIILTENRQLVVSRELKAVKARREFEGAALALSLFYRDPRDNPVVASRDRLPEDFPEIVPVDGELPEATLQLALQQRPEMRQIELSLEKLGVDLRLARNQMLPRLDAGIEASQGLGEERYPDRGEFELKLGVEFSMPLQQREARGRVAETNARIDQLTRRANFARERILAEVQNARVALVAAYEQSERANLNARLALELQDVEQDRFRLGASDLLALQLREQAAFQARVDQADASEQYFIAEADLVAALGNRPGAQHDSLSPAVMTSAAARDER
jgi:outer membrane protein TolC